MNSDLGFKTISSCISTFNIEKIIAPYLLRFVSLICLIFILSFSSKVRSQSAIDSLKTELKNVDRTDQVDVLNQISKLYEYKDPDSSYYFASRAQKLANKLNYKKGHAWADLNMANYFVRIGNYPKSTDVYDTAIVLFTQVDDKEGLLKAYNNKGNMYRLSGDYDQALFNFLESLRISEEVGDQKGIAYAALNAGLIYATRLGEGEEAGLPYFLKTLEICREIDDQRCVAYAINNIALVYMHLKEYDKSLQYHNESLELKKEDGDKTGIASSLGNISDIYFLMGDYETTISYSLQALEIYREVNETEGIIINLLGIGKAYYSMGNFVEAKPYMEEALLKSNDINSLQLKSGTFQYLFEYNLEMKNFKKALECYRQYIIYKDSIYTENSSQQIAEMRTLYETEKKEAEINQLTSEKTIQDLKLRKSEVLKWSFIGASFLTLLLAGFVYYGLRQKQRANKLLKERNKFAIENRKRALSLFGQQVSREVATELLADSFKAGSKKLFACIMFLDIRGFTSYAENKEPDEIIQYQNDVFGFMIDIISKHHGIINQFLGDGFMATFGAPVSTDNDSQNAVNASVEILDILRKKCELNEIPETKVGIGLHSGNIVTGNVGTPERKQYTITGNTVILASRIEQLNKKFGSQLLISEEVFLNINMENLSHESLGVVHVKGREKSIPIVKLI